VKIYKAIDKGEPPPFHEIIIYATLDSKEGEECLRAYISAGAQSRWAVHDLHVVRRAISF
jgi:hypothetical protein